MPIGTLTSEPYNLIKGNSVMARIIAVNYYGDSPYSPAGQGAVMIIVPDSPINLRNYESQTNRYQIGI